jgi:diaminohydroxyphosphoribosylaminopyrimidine deaminase / 5-amino-6-(5-phosphoribosylamino)uracil reductase
MTLNQRIEQWLTEARSTFFASEPPQRPFVTLSYAQSLDGSLTTRVGETVRLSGCESTTLTHQLRSLHDGILVGIGTVLADDPQLTVRHWAGANPQPIVLDSQLRLPLTAKLCQSAKPCWVLTTAQAAQQSASPATFHCEFLTQADNGAGQVDLSLALQLLKQKGIHSLMVEGGATIITALLQAQLVDAVVLTVSPHLVGGYKAVGELGLSSSLPLPRLSPLHSEQLGNDIIVWGKLGFDGGQA